MNKKEQISQESPEQRDRRISREVKDIFKEESDRGIGNPPSSKKPNLDDYDNERETR